MIKLFWWRLQGSEHGNFGDEITRLLIKKLFHKRTVWSPTNECDMIGVGSILEEAYKTKGDNKPYVWSSGLIYDNETRVPIDAFKFCSVRGKLTLGRIDGLGKTSLPIGDGGLLASTLLPLRAKVFGGKKYKIGILPHYKDSSSEFIRVMSHRSDVFIIDSTWPCEKVIESIYRCETLISSSLHGLIVADSVGTPNAHVAMSGLVEGGDYKFRDYYSVFSKERYKPLAADDVYKLSNEQLRSRILNDYIIPQDLPQIKKNIIAAFPFK